MQKKGKENWEMEKEIPCPFLFTPKKGGLFGKKEEWGKRIKDFSPKKGKTQFS